MKCNKCGNEIPIESEFCSYCGNKVEKEEKKTIKLSLKQVIIMEIIVILGIAIVAGICISIWTKPQTSTSDTKQNVQANNVQQNNNYIKVEGTNNKKEEVEISVSKEKFKLQLQEDLNTINNEHLADGYTIDSFIVNGMYNTQENKFLFINYIVSFDNNEKILSVARMTDEYLIPYNIVIDNQPWMLVEEDVSNKIFEFANIMIEYKFKDEYVSIPITDGLNSNLNKEIQEELNKNIKKSKTTTNEQTKQQNMNITNEEIQNNNTQYVENIDNNQNTNNNLTQNNNSNESYEETQYLPPEISITTYKTDETDNNSLTLNYYIKGQDNEEKNITIKSNGKVITNKNIYTTYNYWSGNETINLEEGMNKIEIIVTNSKGMTDKDTYEIKLQYKKPNVSINNDLVATDEKMFELNYGISDEYDTELSVTIKNNGKIITNKKVSTNGVYWKHETIELEKGINKIEVIVTNSKGKTNSAQHEIEY